MIDTSKRWPAKLLLFGEHTVLRGSQALAVPLDLFGASWQQSDDHTLQYDLPKMAIWLRQQPNNLGIDVDQMQEALSQGWYLHSDVPQGYGVGSSGVVCAALLATFGDEKEENTALLKARLANMESFIHGSSSGIDPLVSYLNCPVLLQGAHDPITLANKSYSQSTGATMFLIDSGMPRNGAPYISYVAAQCALSGCLADLSNAYLAAVDTAIEAYLDGNWQKMLDNVVVMSHFQAKWWPEAIPENIRPAWQAGLQDGAYVLKTCGAGGGGFVLGFAPDWGKAQSLLANWRLFKL